MIKVSDMLSDLIERSGLSYRELEEKTGIPHSAIQRYATASTNKIPVDRLQLLCRALGTSAEVLLGWKSEDKKRTMIPVLGTIRAGLPLEAVENIIDYEEIKDEMARDGEYFALIIRGDSMEPRIRECDVVIVRKQEQVDNGDVAVVLINGDEATVKRFSKRGGRILLLPENEAFEPIDGREAQILGVVRGVVREY